MEIIRGIIKKPLRVVVYGPEGIGKTTFASAFPAPVFIDTENSTEFLDVARFPKPTSWTMLLQEIDEILNASSPKGRGSRNIVAGQFRTLVLDTADWAEALCKSHVCGKANVRGIEDFGYGKGYVYLAEEWGRMLNKLTELRDAGMNVIITAHAAMRKFEQPDEMGSYDRWELKLEKKVAPLLREWCDMMLFANYETYVVETQEKKKKAQGGKRVMYTTHHPCWDAKNRQGLADKLPFEFQQIEHCLPVHAGAYVQISSNPDPDLPFYSSGESGFPQASAVGSFPTAQAADGKHEGGSDAGIPNALTDLMRESGVTEAQIQAAVAAKGYYPANTPIRNYDPDFVAGVLVGAWDQVYDMIKGA